MTAGLYIHIPFCERRCGYCDFYTVAQQNSQIPAYLKALRKEVALYSAQPAIANLQFETLYFGGGTPSLLSGEQLHALIDSVFSNLQFVSNSEITIETNPGTVTKQKLQSYKVAGINRLSLGVQSFHPQELKLLERIHNLNDSYKTFENARAAGFDNISMDLIYAMPNQTCASWKVTMKKAVELAPEHISAYNLIFEQGTPFTKKLLLGAFQKSSDEVQREMYLFTMEFLHSRGFFQYEVSNYSKAGFHSIHNKKYWDGSPYLGLGASAHSFIQKKRFWNFSDLVKYQDFLNREIPPVAGEEQIDIKTQAFEKIFLALRQVKGLKLNSFEAEFGESFIEKYLTILTKFFTRNLDDKYLAMKLTNGSEKLKGDFMEIENGFLRLTRKGFLLSDTICSEFV